MYDFKVTIFNEFLLTNLSMGLFNVPFYYINGFYLMFSLFYWAPC